MPQTPPTAFYPRQAYPPESQPPRAFSPAQPQGFPPMPPPPGSLPIMAELDWLRSALETNVRALKYMIDNYNGLLAKAEAEGVTSGTPTFGPATAYAIGALIPAGRYLVVEPGTVSQVLPQGVFVTLAAQGSATTTVTLMPVT